MQQSLALTDLQTIGGAAIAVTIILQLIKSFFTDDRDIRLAAVASGIVVSLLATFALGQHAAVDVGNAVIAGFLGGASAIGIYQLQKPVALLAPGSNNLAQDVSSQISAMMPGIMDMLTSPQVLASIQKANDTIAATATSKATDGDATVPIGNTVTTTSLPQPGT